MAGPPDRKLTPEEQRLYTYASLAAGAVFTGTLVVVVLAVVFLPVLAPGYTISEGTVIGIVVSLSGSILALVGVRSRLRRNGNGNGNGV